MMKKDEAWILFYFTEWLADFAVNSQNCTSFDHVIFNTLQLIVDQAHLLLESVT
mgnify:CR=1 FL=1